MRTGVKAMTSAGVVLALLLTLLVTAATPGGANENETGLCDRVGDVLTWTDEDVDVYQLRGGTDDGFRWIRTVDQRVVTLTPADLAATTTNTFSIRYRVAGQVFDIECVDTEDREPTPLPDFCRRNSNGDELSWTAAPDALDAEYNVRRFTRFDSVWVDTITVADGPATLTVDPDGSYFVRYRTVDNNGSTTIVDEPCIIQTEPTTPQVCVRSSSELLTLTPSLLGEVRSNRMHLRTVEADGSSAFLTTLPANDVQYVLGGNTIGDPNDTFILRYRELDGTVVDLPCASG